ncbi:MAG: choice-of-anchor C domain-containing protein [Gammaproteobacteria bacterium]
MALLFAAPAQANLITNGSFEGGAHTNDFLTLAGGGTAISGWTATNGGVDWIHDNFWEASDGNFSLDLSAISAGGMQAATDFASVIGQTDRISFDLAGNTGGGNGIKNIRVGATSQDFSFDISRHSRHSTQSMGWESNSFIYTATSTTTSLGSLSLENSAFGPALDNVSVLAVQRNVPEPGPFALLALGLVLTGPGLQQRRG